MRGLQSCYSRDRDLRFQGISLSSIHPFVECQLPSSCCNVPLVAIDTCPLILKEIPQGRHNISVLQMGKRGIGEFMTSPTKIVHRNQDKNLHLRNGGISHNMTTSTSLSRAEKLAPGRHLLHQNVSFINILAYKMNVKITV